MSAPSSPRPEFLEPLPSPKARSCSPKPLSPQPSPSKPAEPVELEEHETYIMNHYTIPLREEQKKNYETFLADGWDSLPYWQSRLELLQRLKWPYVKKRAWSAEIVVRVEELNREIEEAELRIAELSYEDEEEEGDA